ncbi:MAG: nitroreductase family protein [Firmicutes bacterium]|nr:nitroreductase family protein [Bacillota bacterium]
MVTEIIKKRKSIRRYNPNGTVTDAQLKQILEAAMHAPSACNTRPWEFTVIRNRKVLDKFVEFHSFAKMLKTAAAAIVVCALPDTQSGKSGEGMWQHDCGAATQNILLAATELGLGTCWCGLHPVTEYMEQTRRILNLSPDKVPFCIIAIGEPAEDFGGRGFYDEAKVTWVD